MANAWLLAPLTPASLAVPVGTVLAGVPANVLNDYAGIVLRMRCDGADGFQAWLQVDLGADTTVDALMLFGVEEFPAESNVSIAFATAAQGPFTGAYALDNLPSAYAGSEPVLNKNIVLWTPAAPVKVRYLRIQFAGGVRGPNLGLRIARLVVGKRIALERNFSNGAIFGVRDLGSLDFSARGVLLRRYGAKLRTAGLTFSSVRKDEVDQMMRPLLERIGNTDMVALVTDPAPDAQRQNRCFYGPLVGDLGTSRRNAVAYEAKLNLVSIF